jgi:hypothetical protein
MVANFIPWKNEVYSEYFKGISELINETPAVSAFFVLFVIKAQPNWIKCEGIPKSSQIFRSGCGSPSATTLKRN